jgi:glycosyltransferase involved in cell wall biosynthesis
MLELIHPPFDRVSGGNAYNRNLLAAAAARGIALSSALVSCEEAAACARERSDRFRLWDSVFLHVLSAHAPASGDWGLLLHYLPSTDPALKAPERLRLAASEDRVLSRASLVVVTSREVADRLRRRHAGLPVRVCEPGVSSAFLGPPCVRAQRRSGPIDLVTVANLIPAKGHLELLKALARLREHPWRWHLVGDPDIDPQYTRRFGAEVSALGLVARVQRHGVLDPPAVAGVLDRAELFIFASRYESYGMVLAEAAARGLPALTTDVGAASRIYRQGVDGLISSPEDSAGLTRNLARLLADARLRDCFRERLRSFRARTWNDALEDFIVAAAPYLERR